MTYIRVSGYPVNVETRVKLYRPPQNRYLTGGTIWPVICNKSWNFCTRDQGWYAVGMSWEYHAESW